jgi:hypothetical protein
MVYNLTAKVPKHFTGLRGIAGVSVEEPERRYGPPKPFGKPGARRWEVLAPVRPGYVGIGGIAFGAGPNVSIAPCAAFNCTPSQYVVGDTSAKAYYRCYCPSARAISPENIKCMETPSIAERIGYHAGLC